MKLIDPRNVSSGRFYSHGDAGGHHYTAEEMHNDDVAHEESDINLAALIWSAAILVGVMVGAAVLMYGLFWGLEKRAEAVDPRPSPRAKPATVMPPTTNTSPEFGSASEPRLLTSEPTYLKDVREREQQVLQSYGWVDEKTAVAHIPIDEAKKKLLERGIPVRPDPVSDPRMGTHLPAYGESSSGRVVTQKAPTEAGGR